MAFTETRTLALRLTSPVRNRRGGFSPLKASVFGLLFVPGLVFLYWYFTGQLGARPVLALIHGSGLWAVRLLAIVLALTPIRFLFDWPGNAVLRRMIGVAAAAYAAIHLLLYCIQQQFHMLHVASEIVHRFYLTIGFVTLLILLTLAATSTDGSVRRLGRNWKRLHRLIYLAAGLALFHYFLQAKANVSAAVILSGAFVWLLAWRLLPAGWRDRSWAAFGLGVVAMLGAAGLEAGWYAGFTHVVVARVWNANFQFVRLRPSAVVAIWASVAFVAVALDHAVRFLMQRRAAGRA